MHNQKKFVKLKENIPRFHTENQVYAGMVKKFIFSA